MKKNHICVVGGGKWGLNHIKTLIANDVFVGCVDSDKAQLKKIKNKYPSLACYLSIEEAVKNNYDGYIVSTPSFTHASLAMKIIKNSKPILIEKPLSTSVKEAENIKLQLEKYNSKLLVGHLLLFHPAIQKIKSLILNGKIGEIKYIYSNRLNYGTVRKEESVLWSFAPHDISLFQFFTESYPKKISSFGADFLKKDVHDTAITYLKYPNQIEGHIFVSWLHPFKEHRLIIIGSNGSLHFEDSALGKPLILYQKKSLKNKIHKEIKYDTILPLDNMIKYFIDIINGKPVEIAGIEEGIETVKILESASKSLSAKQ